MELRPRRPSLIFWTSAFAGAALSCILTSKRAYHRAQAFTDSLNPAPLEAPAARLVGCQYRAEVLQQQCEALVGDFPEQEAELKELSAWIAGAVR